MREKYISQWEEQFNEQMKVRMEKRAKLTEADSHPYKHGVKPTITAAELKEKYGEMEKEEIGETPDFELVGRAMMVRDFGKAAFIQVDDGKTRFQFYGQKKVTSDEVQ